MLYNRLLQFGHWGAFLDYAWRNSDCAQVSGCATPKAWLAVCSTDKDEAIDQLFRKSKYDVFELAEKYFHEQSVLANDNCLRCTNKFLDGKLNLCITCGWDYELGRTIEAHHAKKAIEINSRIHSNQLFNELKQRKSGQQLRSLEASVEMAKAEQTSLSERINAFTTDIQNIETDIKRKSDLRRLLEDQSTALTQEVDELNESLRNGDSLFKNFQPLADSRTLYIKTEGRKLFASSRSEIKFPADLVVALQNSQNKNASVVKNAECFIIIKKEEWEPCGDKKWSCDIGLLSRGNSVKGNYRPEFYHLNLGDYDCKLAYGSSTITI